MDLELIKEVISKAHPPGSEITQNPGEVSPEERYFVISGPQGPRWIIPQNPRHGLPVIKQWSPQRIPSRIKWAVAMRIYQAGFLESMPGVLPIGVSSSNNIDWSGLWWTDKNPPVVVIIIGFPGAQRKATITFVDTTSCQARMIVKVPLDPLAAGKILFEADILTRLTRHTPPISPKPLFVNKKEGIAAQEVINGRQVGRKFARAHLQFLNRLQGNGHETSLRELTEKMAANLARLTCVDDENKILLERLFEKTDDPVTLNTVWAHGDFSPINLIWVNKEKIIAVDWEDSILHGPPLWDILYFFFSQMNAFEKKMDTLLEIRKNPYSHEYVKSFNFDNLTIEKLYILFLGSFFMEKLEQKDHDYGAVFKREILFALKTRK